jgi:hypothetical protein
MILSLSLSLSLSDVLTSLAAVEQAPGKLMKSKADENAITCFLVQKYKY